MESATDSLLRRLPWHTLSCIVSPSLIIITLNSNAFLCSSWNKTKAYELLYLGRFRKYSLTYSMVQSPSWEANRSAASQEIPRISRNPKVHYRTHKRPPPDRILRQLDTVHTPISHFLKIDLNIILPSTPGSRKWNIEINLLLSKC